MKTIINVVSLGICCLILLAPSRLQAAITKEEAALYAQLTWGISDITDDVFSETLDLSYSGIPYKNWIDFLINAPGYLQPLADGHYTTAARGAYQYALGASFDELISQAGLTGVMAPAKLGVWPIEQALSSFYSAVADASFNKQCQFYFAARSAGNSQQSILDLEDNGLLNADQTILITSDILTKYGGWLCVTTSYLVGGPPGFTPEKFFDYAEIMWQSKLAYSSSFKEAGRYLAQSFHNDAIAGSATVPAIIIAPKSVTVSLGDTATFTVTASGTGPLFYQWQRNGVDITGARSWYYTTPPALSANNNDHYSVRVSNAQGNKTSGTATLTVNGTLSTSPTISYITPSQLQALPSPQPKSITISGSNFKPAGDLNTSSLIFYDPYSNPYLRTPSYATTTELRCDIDVKSAVGTWSVVVTNAGQTASSPKNFTVITPSPTTGSLIVTLSPPSAIGAQWNVDGGPFRNSGDIVTGLTPGTHTVSFKGVAGFTSPQNQSVSIVANQVITVPGVYAPITPSTYQLTVISDHGGIAYYPERANRLYSPGEPVRIVAYASAGWHFDHWSGDASGSFSILDIVMDRNKTVTANYATGDWSVGAINVTIQPAEAIAAGARWKADSGDWRNSGVPMNDAYIGDHYLEFSSVPGWTKPDSRSVTVTGGQTASVPITYTQDTAFGTLIVTLSPLEAVTAGAKWRVNGGSPQNNGASLSLSPGSAYTITFDSVPGWTAPGNQSATIRPGQTTIAAGNYLPSTLQPVISGIFPSFGRISGGTLLTIDGANFVAPVSVTIGGIQAGNVTVLNSTRVNCLTPPQATYKKTVPVTVQTAVGSATSPNGFTYGPEHGTNLNFVTQLGGEVRTAAIQGNYAFIGQGSRMVVLDISSPSSPTPVGTGFAFASKINNIKIDGHFAYIANAEEGLQVVNISNPLQPFFIGTFSTQAPAQSVVVSGGRAYVASTSVGLQIVDVTDPANLRLVGAAATEGWAFDVAVSVSAQGIFAYIANLYGTFKVLNVTDPAASSIVGSLSLGDNLYSVVYAGSRVYVGTSGQCIIVDVTNPSNVTTMGTFSNGGGPGIAYSGGFLYTVGSAGLRIVDATTPSSLNEVGALLGFRAYPLSQVTLVAGNAFVSAGADGFRIIDVSNPATPTARGQYVDFVGYAGGAAFANNTLYIANDTKLENLDVHDPATPVRRSPFSPAGQAQGVRVFGSLAYILEGNFVQIVDISNPQSIALRGTIQPTMTTIGDIYVSGVTGFLTSQTMADGWSPSLSIFDLSQPSAPNPKSSLHLLSGTTAGNAAGLTARGSFAYIAVAGVGLRIVDVSNSQSPQLRGLISGLERALSVTLTTDGTHALVSCRDAGLKIVDVRDPDNPRLVSSYAIEGVSTVDAEIVDDLVYVAASDKGVLVLDISDRANPRLVRSYNTADSATAIVVNGSTLYVADGYGGLVVLTIPDIETPKTFITNPVFPALSPTYTNTTGSMNLGGSATDNKGVTRVTWSNSRGGGGDASGTESWLVNGIVLQPGTNVLTVTAFDQAGNGGSDTLTVIYQPQKQNQTITFPAIANRTFGDAPVTLAAAASSGLTVSFTVVPPSPATLANNTMTLLGAGTVTIQADQSGNELFNPAPPVRVSFTVAKADQAIAMGALSDKLAGDPAFPIAATASSGLPVYFDIVSGPAVLDNNVITLLGGGIVTVSAWQPGNANYNAAVTVQRSFIVAKLTQTITFGALSKQTLGDAPFPLSASASSGLPVLFALVSGPATLNGNILTLTGTGTVVVRASQLGNATNAPAANVDQTISVQDIADSQGPTLTINYPADGAMVNDPSLTVSGTATDSGFGNNGISSVTVNGVSGGGGTASGANTANWSAAITLVPGLNTISVIAMDNLNNPSNKQISVTYNPPSYTLTVIASPSDGGTVTGSGSYPGNSSQTISATANQGWTFTGWNDGNTETPRVVIVPPGGAAYTAYFTRNMASLSVSANPANGGTVSGSGSYPVNSSQTISATANPGWTFTGWNDGNKETPRVVTVPPGGATYTANFSVTPDITQPTVVISSPSAGQVFTSSPITVTLTASDPGTPSTGVALVQVQVNGGAWQTASDPANWSVSVTLNSGLNTINARCQDTAGNYSTLSSVDVSYNQVPRILPVPVQMVDELTTNSVMITAEDADLPVRNLRIELDPGAPAGARLTQINRTNAVFSWTPTEAQGPGSYDVLVWVTDDGTPPQSGNAQFKVLVWEVNQVPDLIVPLNQTIDELTTNTVMIVAKDADLPVQELRIELDPSAPAGARLTQINRTNAVFTWTPTDAQGPGSYDLVVWVTDDGVPPYSQAAQFNVQVREVKIRITGITVSPLGAVSISWTAQPGTTYRVQRTANLSQAQWENVGEPVTSDSASATKAFSDPYAKCYYRIMRER